MSKVTLTERIAAIQADAEARIAREKAYDERREQIRLANLEAARKAQELRDELEGEHDIIGHPKRDLIWSKAWEHGHACGLSDVRFWYGEFAELVK